MTRKHRGGVTADPDPLTLPWTVTLPPFAQMEPEFTTSLSMINPPLPVASSVPEFVIGFAPVSTMSGCVPLASIVPSLIKGNCPLPR